MTPPDAAKLLDLPADATPEQLEARFLELRRKLEDKIAKAPTPGLQAKYRESLAEITTAFETLTLAADSSSLPVIQKQGAGSKETGAGGPASLRAGSPVAGVADPGASRAAAQSPGSATPATATRRKSGGKEFAVIAVIAVAVLGAGGWWVLKTKAENAEKARIAEETKSAAEAKAAGDKAEAVRKAEEVRLAAEAEKTRQEKLSGQLRSELAEHKVAWEAVEREERNAERRLAELKSDLRSLRDAPAGPMAEAQALVAAQQAFYDWLSETLARHPAKVARSKAEELLAARQLDEARAAAAELKTALADLEKHIPERRAALLDLEGELTLSTGADVTWTLHDAFGRTRSGQGSAQFEALAVGPGRLQLSKPRWPVREEKFVIHRNRPAQLTAEFASYPLNLDSSPADVEVRKADGTTLGMTPLRLDGFPPGTLELTLRKEGYYDHKTALVLPTASPEVPVITLRVRPTGLVKPERWSGPEKLTMVFRGQQAIDHSGSTGMYAKSVAIGNTTFHDIEEWDFSQPDAQGVWQQVIRRIVRQDRPPEQAPYTAVGAVLRHRRQPDGTWQGKFLQGSPANATMGDVYSGNFPGTMFVRFGFLDCWPDREVMVGGTWPVKPGNLPGYESMKILAGRVEGKLLAIERNATEEWADIEYSFQLETGVPEFRTHDTGTMRLRVNLAEMFVSAYEHRSQSSSSIRADAANVLITNGRFTYTMTFSKR